METLTIIYLLSFGPACWLSERVESTRPVISVVYAPVLKFAIEPGMGLAEETPLSDQLLSYARWGARFGWQPVLKVNGQLTWKYCP